ncbi:MAG: hypothetical protein A2Z51_10330 [Deltaproteobacteria bacterium RBG_19FT_COMBO_52_11]|jgi:ferredoxin|nr:MAG: hypothetical protein A2Z51_10330 [Deltaproteobacteria bacterium RBG_19FT_COMBO_52_11]
MNKGPKMYRKITKENVIKLLAGLKGRAEVLGPAQVNGLWAFRPFNGQDLPQGFQNSRLPPKGLFFESLRELFEWKAPAGDFQLTPLPPPEGQRVIFGIKPCDARALKILEPVFAKDYQDIFYLKNLSRTLLLGQACRTQCVGSFCTEMGIDPQDSADCDLLLRETPGGYVAKISTERGQVLIEGNNFFEEASAEDWDAARGEIKGKRAKPVFDLEKVKGRIGVRFMDEDLWKRVSAKCINCGICTYLCPTCHCFDLSDLQMPGQGIRYRCGDSCAFPSFTKMPVHNPREEKWRRYRQRVSHKFNFFHQNWQTIACVGCGRCVAHCPVNLDLREVLLEVAR